MLGSTIVVLLAGYAAAMKCWPTPGYGAGCLDSPEGNLAAYIDRLWLGKHLWPYTHSQWDPEGPFSTLPAIATTLSGTLTGIWFKQAGSPKVKTIWLFSLGVLGICLGLVVQPWFPVNKALWSPSYVFLSGGWACVVLASCLLYTDVWKLSFGTRPFLILGSNPILVYFFSTYTAWWLGRIKIAPDLSIYRWLFQHSFAAWFGSTALASHLFALAYLVLWMILTSPFYRRRIFIRI
jgi:predicted acyltransferase